MTSGVDLFALGLVLWQALIGTHPYVERCPPRRSLEVWLPEHLRKNARCPVAEAARAAPAGMCEAIECLIEPAQDRTKDAERVLAALEPHVRPASAAMLGRLGESAVERRPGTPIYEP